MFVVFYLLKKLVIFRGVPVKKITLYVTFHNSVLGLLVYFKVWQVLVLVLHLFELSSVSSGMMCNAHCAYLC